ncbi:hypothetical protein M3Y99_00394900 [Aphelenchoides fujianensis]|nr:hypothetical protein M3Y99_00394900 [Aphelenchoides fujianensis]
MPQNSRLNRSISMSQMPKRRSASIAVPPHEFLPKTENRWRLAMRKFYSTLVKVMFSKQTIKTPPSGSYSSFRSVLQFFSAFGVCWLEARAWSKLMVVLIAIYNVLVLLVQVAVLIVLVVDFNSANVGEYQWTGCLFFVIGILIVFSLWMNARLHSVRQNVIAEALCTYSISSDWQTTCSASKSAKNWPNTTIFSCGIFCDVLLYYVCIISIVTIAGGTTIFVVLGTSTGIEAGRLLKDINKYPTNDGLDHLIFRFQSIEQSAHALNRYFSYHIFGFLLAVVVGTAVILRHYTQLMIEKAELGAMVFCFFYGFSLMILLAFLTVGTFLNERLIRFREASQKVSDFEQIYVTNQNSVRLLSFMLRLSDSKERIRMGTF